MEGVWFKTYEKCEDVLIIKPKKDLYELDP